MKKNVLSIPQFLAPIKLAILPLTKKMVLAKRLKKYLMI